MSATTPPKTARWLIRGVVAGVLYSYFVNFGSSAGFLFAGACALVLLGMWLYEVQQRS